MAPILFLFLMQAVAETLMRLWRARGRTATMTPLRYHTTTTRSRGRLVNQPLPLQTQGTTFDFLYSLFVDDGAFISESRDDLQQSAEDIHSVFKKFGLIMDSGTLNTDSLTYSASKTEAMFFPASTSQGTSIVATPAPITFGPNQQHRITFTNCFKYLGSLITPTLNDEHEITQRLQKAQAQLAGLYNFFRCSAVDLKIKCQIFRAILVNTALYGCESWTLTMELQDRLQAFYYRGLRQILGITMYHVQEYQICNSDLLTYLDLPDILDLVKIYQFYFAGKIARMPDCRLPRKLLGSWIARTRPRKRPLMSLRRTMLTSLESILEDDIPQQGGFQHWFPMAADANA